MSRREPDAEELSELRLRVRPYYKEKRYAHALSVENETAYIAKLLLPEREGSLRASALLHDAAKKLSYEMQLNYIRDFGIIGKETKPVPDVAHAFAGVGVIKAHFPEYAEDEDILSAVKYHATGRAGMTVFEAIIFLADYIEPTRTYESCTELRRRFHEELERAGTRREMIDALRRAVLTAMENTVAYVREKRGELDTETLDAIAYFRCGGELAETE